MRRRSWSKGKLTLICKVLLFLKKGEYIHVLFTVLIFNNYKDTYERMWEKWEV